jgi:tryptophan-rich sensory protein
MDTREWYESLKKPGWAPLPEVFGRVWSVIYPIIFAVNIYVVYMLSAGTVTWLIALPFWLNLFFNLAFTPLQFGLRKQLLSTICILLVLSTILLSMIIIYPYSLVAVVAFIPYLLWVSIASVLQISLWWLNR